MLLVNNAALDTATPKQLMHAPWNGGVHMADLVFPWFLFCVGVAIPFAYESFRRKGLPLWQFHLKAVKRTAILVFLGCVIDSSLAKRPLFDLGVLQIIGLAYLVGVLLYELPVPRRMLVAAACLAAYWAAIRFLPIPGIGVGLFEEQQNLIAHINRTYLSDYNLSGLPSVIPTAAMVLISTAIGDILKNGSMPHLKKLTYLSASGLALIAAGLIWNLNLPFNKPLWTPSYILLTAGLASIALALFYLIVDVKGWRRWAFPLVVFGSNAIVAYVAPILIKVHVLREWTVGAVSVQQWFLERSVAWMGRVPGGWLYTTGYIVVWWIVLCVLYRKKIFLRV